MGFGSGKLMTEEHDKAIVADLRVALGESGVLIWDGDFFHPQSFTRVLDLLLQGAKIPAVAFYFRSGREEFVNAWRNRLPASAPVHLVLLDDPPGLVDGTDEKWLWLGKEALRLTGSSRVFAIGGGGTAAEKATACATNGEVQWSIYKVPR